MKKFSPWLLVLPVIVAVSTSKPVARQARARTLRVFVIGNSFSQNATRYLPQMAKQGGHELVIGRAEAGGHSLQMHWEAHQAAEADANDEKGKRYGGRTLRDLLSRGTWDIVTIQQASVFSAWPDAYRPYARQMYDFVHQLQPQAEIVMHQTWAYRSDAGDFAFVAKNQKAQSDREMWEKSLAAYHTIAAELGTRLIPVGDAFWRVGADSRWSYVKDTKFDFAKPSAPNLPDQTNSLHVGYHWKDAKLELDARHANEAGCYLGGLVWYGFLFGESPQKVTFTPPQVLAPFAARLRQAAAQALQMPLQTNTQAAAGT